MKFQLYLAVILGMCMCNTIQAQSIKYNDILKDISFSLKGGTSLFYGDMRQYKYFPVIKYGNEWGYGLSASLNGRLDKTFGVEIGLNNGQIKGTRRDLNERLKGFYNELSFNINFNFNEIIFSPKFANKVQFYGFIGVGMFRYKNKVYNFLTNEPLRWLGGTANKLNSNSYGYATSIPIGLDIKYTIHPQIDISTGVKYSFLQNDDIDFMTIKNTGNDSLLFINIGASYYFSLYYRSRIKYTN